MNVQRRDFLAACSTLSAASLLHPHVVGADETSRIRVGQIGTAHAHAAGKMATLRAFPEIYDVVGIVEPDKQRRERAGNSKAYTGLTWLTEDQLLNTAGLSCVAVETEIKDLVPAAQRCIDAGVHVHLDKPAGESMSALRRLHAAAITKGRCIQMGYMFRYNPAFQLAKRATSEGWLGTVFEAHGVISKKINQAARDTLRQQPGGTMFELGCHLVDAMVWILGPPKKVTAYPRRTLEDGLDDNMLAVLEFEHATATVRSSVVEPFGFRRRQFTVVGTEGVVDIRPLEPPRMELSLEKPRGTFTAGTQSPDFPKGRGRYDGDMLDLAQVIRGEKQLEWDAAHDLAVHEAILRASGMAVDN